MAQDSPIEWTGKTWNPLAAFNIETGKRGWFCVHVHEGCRFCYAEGFNLRLGNGLAYTAANREKIRWETVNLGKPLSWRKPDSIFVDSMFDLFEPSIPRALLYRIWVTMALAWRHQFQILTKHPDLAAEFLSTFTWADAVKACRGPTGASVIPRTSLNDIERAVGIAARFSYDHDCSALPLRNVMIGTSPCDQGTMDSLWKKLRRAPTAGRWFLSIEPMLGPVDLRRALPAAMECSYCGHRTNDRRAVTCCKGYCYDTSGKSCNSWPCPDCHAHHAWCGSMASVSWVIVGGENDHAARPIHPDWVRSVRDQCVAAGVPFFFKQWGSQLPGEIFHPESRRTNDYVHWQDGEEEINGEHIDFTTEIISVRKPPGCKDAESAKAQLDAGKGHVDDSLCREAAKSCEREPCRVAGYCKGDDLPNLVVRKKVRKERAGRLLDGRTWDEFPKAQP